MPSRSASPRRLALALVFAVSAGAFACSLLVDTGELDGTRTTPPAQETPSSEGGVAEEGGVVDDGGTPVEDAAVRSDGGTVGDPRVIATGFADPQAVALDATRVWVGQRGQGAIYTVRKDTREKVFFDSYLEDVAGPMTVLPDTASRVIWSGRRASNCCGYVNVSTKNGDAAAGQNRFGVVSNGHWYNVAMDGAFIFGSSTNSPIAVWRRDTVQPVGSLSTPRGGPLALDTSNVYWIADTGAIRRHPKSNFGTDAGAPEDFANAAGIPADLAVDATHVYWTLDLAGTVVMLPKVSPRTTPSVLASQQPSPKRIFVFDEHVYWINAGEGSVMRVSKSASSPPEPIATGQNQPSALAVDATGVYWVNAGSGELMFAPAE